MSTSIDYVGRLQSVVRNIGLIMLDNFMTGTHAGAGSQNSADLRGALLHDQAANETKLRCFFSFANGG